MAIKSLMSLDIDSKRLGKTFRVWRFTEIFTEIDLLTDCDVFDFVLKNPNGMYSGMFSKFDACRIAVNGKQIMYGTVDKVEYIMSETDDYIKISGRDWCFMLVDNDATPDTLESVQPKIYIEERCNAYDIKCSVSEAEIYEKLVIGCGESEISIFNNILLESKQRVWFLIDTLYTGEWNMNAPISHTFTSHTNINGIPIKTFRLIEDGTDMRSDIYIYGSNGSGGFDLVGTAENQYMKKIGISKLSTRRAYSDNASSKYTSIADKDMRNSFRDGTELVIGVRLDSDNVYLPNTTARIVHGNYGIDSIFFIRKVEYTKSIDSGSIVTLTMIPADSTFEKIWQADGTSVTNRRS